MSCARPCVPQPQIVTFLEALTSHRDRARATMQLALATGIGTSAQEGQQLAAAQTDYKAARQVSETQGNAAAKAALATGKRAGAPQRK